jgi:hypothetical protein
VRRAPAAGGQPEGASTRLGSPAGVSFFYTCCRRWHIATFAPRTIIHKNSLLGFFGFSGTHVAYISLRTQVRENLGSFYYKEYQS